MYSVAIRHNNNISLCNLYMHCACAVLLSCCLKPRLRAGYIVVVYISTVYTTTVNSWLAVSIIILYMYLSPEGGGGGASAPKEPPPPPGSAPVYLR